MTLNVKTEGLTFVSSSLSLLINKIGCFRLFEDSLEKTLATVVSSAVKLKGFYLQLNLLKKKIIKNELLSSRKELKDRFPYQLRDSSWFSIFLFNSNRKSNEKVQIKN